MPCPYMINPFLLFPDFNYPVHVVWHYLKYINTNVLEMRRYLLPTCLRCPSGIRQHHFGIYDFAQDGYPIPRTYRHEICGGFAVIKTLEAN